MKDGEIIDFLSALLRAGGTAKRTQLPLTTRAQDRARQTCREAGWASYNKATGAYRWSITDLGRRVYSELINK